MTTRPLDLNVVLDRALADPLRIAMPLNKEQKYRLRYWDYFLHDLTERIRRQAAKKEQEAL